MLSGSMQVEDFGDGREGEEQKKELMERYRTRFKQQKSRHLEIQIGPAAMSPLAIVIGIFFIPIGLGLIYSSAQNMEHVIDYTNCDEINKSCSLNFTLARDFKGKVIIYYALTNFYQNHRRFAKSKDNNQLHADSTGPFKECKPYDVEKSSGKIYWPCGALANAMFQDNFTIYSFREKNNVHFERKGIAWESDIAYRFKNPPDWNKPEFQQNHAKPEHWRWNPWDMPDGLQNEDFVVWMRVSALANFRKVYATVGSGTGDHKSKHDLLQGLYRLDVDSVFEVKSFGGTKSVIIASKGILGGKNPVLGYGFVATGLFLVIVGIFLLYVHFDTIRM